MKTALAIALILGLAVASFSDDLVIASFYANRGYIAANLCEQRMHPGNTCQGCCQLRKRLNEAASNDAAVPPPNSREHETFQSTAAGAVHLSLAPPSSAFEFPDSATPLCEPFVRLIDHPPQSDLVS